LIVFENSPEKRFLLNGDSLKSRKYFCDFGALTLRLAIRFSAWRSVLFRAAIFWFVLIVANFALILLASSQFWSSVSYFFGFNTETRLITLLFVEGTAIFTLGLVWTAGAMEARFGGSNIVTNPYYQRGQLEQAGEEVKQQNAIGKVMMLAGTPLLIISLSLLLF
jgi:hypothetical protein